MSGSPSYEAWIVADTTELLISGYEAASEVRLRTLIYLPNTTSILSFADFPRYSCMINYSVSSSS